MLDVVIAQIRGLSKAWEDDAKKMKRISQVNPVADTRAYDASELSSLLDQIEKDTEQLTTAQFAKMHKTTPQTVTAWARDKKIPAIPRGARGYLIPRSAIPPRRRATKKREVKSS
jgi:DNA-binding transcriptional regulator YiaG